MTIIVAEIKVFADLPALSHFGAELFARLARQAVETQGKFLAALSGGSTPTALYRLLAAEPFRSDVPWPWMHFFWGDERCVPPDDPQSNYRQAWDAFLTSVPVPADNIHRVRGELDPQTSAADYNSQLADLAAPGLEYPILDLVLLGLGADGHTASLFPGSEQASGGPALAVRGHYQGRPTDRVTLSPQVFNAARNVAFLVAGEEKAAAVADSLGERLDPLEHPAHRIHPQDGTLWWLLDQSAAGLLKSSESPRSSSLN